MLKQIEDRIFDHLVSASGPETSSDLSRRFLGSPSPVGSLVIDRALSRDARFSILSGKWSAKPVQSEVYRLSGVSWAVLGGSTVSLPSGRFALYFTLLWKPGDPSARKLRLFSRATGAASSLLSDYTSSHWGVACDSVSEFVLLKEIENAFRESPLVWAGFHEVGVHALLDDLEELGWSCPDFVPSIPAAIRALMGDGVSGKIQEFMPHYGLTVYDDDPFATEIRNLPDVLSILLEELSDQGITTRTSLENRLNLGREPFSFDSTSFDRTDLSSIPESPGVYQFHDSCGSAIYIGKSVNLRRRVLSYFTWKAEGDPKLESIQQATRRLSTQSCGSDLEALLEENRLIQALRPPLNTQFDVHPSQYQKPLSEPVLCVLPGAMPPSFALAVLTPARRVHVLHIHSGSSDVSKLAEILDSCCGPNPTLTPTHSEDAFPLALRWLRKNSDRVPYSKYFDHPDSLSAAKFVLNSAPV